MTGEESATPEQPAERPVKREPGRPKKPIDLDKVWQCADNMMSQKATAIKLGFDPHRFQKDPELRAAYDRGFVNVNEQHLIVQKAAALSGNVPILIHNAKTFFGQRPDGDPMATLGKVIILFQDAAALKSIAFGRSASDSQLTDFFEDEDEIVDVAGDEDDGFEDPGEDGNAGAAAACC